MTTQQRLTDLRRIDRELRRLNREGRRLDDLFAVIGFASAFLGGLLLVFLG